MLIGGLHPSGEGSGSCDGFDAYCATVHANPDALWDDLQCLLDSAGMGPREVDCGKVRFYANARQLVDDKGRQLLVLKSGGSNPHPHMECLGPQAALVGSYLREFYSHQPTRIDHALDMRAEGLFQRLLRYSRRLCKRHRLKLSFAGDWSNADSGRTIYIGSRKSQVFVRIYEKGLKYAADFGLPVTAQLREWVRVELEFCPQTPIARQQAPTIIGKQMWGSTDWTREVAAEMLSIDTQRVTIREKRESHRDRALRFMGQQYARHAKDLFEKDCKKDFCEFGRALGVLFGIKDADY